MIATTDQITKNVILFPIISMLSFLVFTEILFFWGPINWDQINSEFLGLYFIILNLALYFGYRSGVTAYKEREPQNKIKRYDFYIHCLLWFAFFTIFIRILALWGINSISPMAIYNHVINSINMPEQVYNSKLSLSSGPLLYLTIILSPLTFMVIPISLFNIKRLSLFYKYFTYIICFFELFIWIGQGVRKGILDLILIIFFISVARNTSIINNIKKYKKYIALACFLVVIFLYYFLYSNLKRYGLENPEDLIEKATIFNIKDFYKDNFSSLFLMIIASIEGYLCQGYYALSYALSSDFVFSYGLGSSWFGINLSTRLGLDVFFNTYIYQLSVNQGIDPMVNWHSLYTWLASDYTFFGVPVIIFIMGRLFAISWLDTLTNRSFFAPAMFCLFLIMIFYSFANNQVFSLQFIAFWGVLIFWINDRKIIICQDRWKK